MTGRYQPGLVALSIAVAILSAYAALDLGTRVGAARDRVRTLWLAAGALMMGLGIWAMHFVGMLAFVMPMPVTYAPGETLRSVLVAVLSSGLALFAVTRPRLSPPLLALGGVCMGLGIAAMHYLGMSAMRMQATTHYDARLVAASLAIAVGASLGALALAFRLRGEGVSAWWPKIAGAVTMGLAIAGMHYTGMAAASFSPAPEVPSSELAEGIAISELGAAAIGMVCLVGLGLMLLGSLVDLERRASFRTLAFLSEASVRLGRGLDPQATWTRVVELAVPFLADVALLDVVRDEGRTLARAARSCDCERTRHDPFLAPEHTQPLDEALRAQVLQNELLVPEAEDVRLPDDPAFDAFVRRVRPRSIVRVPLVRGGEPVALLTLLRCEGPRRFGPAELTLAHELARRASAALDNALLFQEATQAVRARDEFLSIASHELRTPLTALRLQIEGLRRVVQRAEQEPADTKRLHASVGSLTRQADRLTRLVDELLDVSRISAGKLQLQREAVDLAEVVEETLARHREQLAQERCELRLTTERVVGRWDRLRLDQVVTNLLTNAMKYGRGKPIEVDVGASPAGAVLRVRDHGIGIAQSEQARVFERFERAVSGREFSGLGLGLYITRQIVQAHGGHIALQSTLGEGALFTVTLPTEEGTGTGEGAEPGGRGGGPDGRTHAAASRG